MTKDYLHLSVTLKTLESDRTVEMPVNRLIIAGWTGRDEVAVEAHIEELEQMGIPRPARTPIFYRVAATRLTTATRVEMSGSHSSGEVEFVIAGFKGELWAGTASDHTDREAEKQGITLSKQLCDKPIAPALWRYADVKDHWDDLRLTSEIKENGTSVTYQDGPVTAMRPVEDLLSLFSEEDGEPFGDGDVMMGGTLAAIGGIRPSDTFSFAIVDPVLNRRIDHAYTVTELPVAG